jgi:hypothetical protein
MRKVAFFFEKIVCIQEWKNKRFAGKTVELKILAVR